MVPVRLRPGGARNGSAHRQAVPGLACNPGENALLPDSPQESQRVGTNCPLARLADQKALQHAGLVQQKESRPSMLGWALTFFVIALIAAVFGFGGIASASAGIAQILFVVFLALFVIALVARAVRGSSRV